MIGAPDVQSEPLAGPALVRTLKQIEAHPIRIGAGDWTAVTGVFNDGSTMATLARWEDGQVVEEYLFQLATGH